MCDQGLFITKIITKLLKLNFTGIEIFIVNGVVVKTLYHITAGIEVSSVGGAHGGALVMTPTPELCFHLNDDHSSEGQHQHA